MFYIAIVGSRRRTDQDRVKLLVCKLHMSYGNLTIISGGCTGPDLWATDTAIALGIPVIEHRPVLPAASMPKWAYTRAYYARNKIIAQECDEMYAFVAADRTGGTENAIAHAKKLNKRVTVILVNGSQFTIEPKPTQVGLPLGELKCQTNKP